MAPVCVYPLHTMWPPGYSTRLRQHPSDLYYLRSVYQQGAPSFLEKEKVQRCQVRTVRRMLEEVPMEFLTQQGLCLPDSMWTCIVVQQNNSTRELVSSARWSNISSACRKRITPGTSRSAGFSIGTAMSTAISALFMTGPTYNCMRQLFNITLNTRNKWSPATKQVRGLNAQTVFTYWMAFVNKKGSSHKCTFIQLFSSWFI